MSRLFWVCSWWPNRKSSRSDIHISHCLIVVTIYTKYTHYMILQSHSTLFYSLQKSVGSIILSFYCCCFSYINVNILVFTVMQPNIKVSNRLFSLVMAGTGHQDHWCSQWGQRQCQVPLQPGEILWPSLQQRPCKTNDLFTLKMTCSAVLPQFVRMVYFTSTAQCYKMILNRSMCANTCSYIGKMYQCIFNNYICFEPGINGGCNPRSYQCHQDDSQYISLLQHIWKDNITLCQGSCGFYTAQCQRIV